MVNLVRGRTVLVGKDVQTNFPTVNHYEGVSSLNKWRSVSQGHWGYPRFPGNMNVGGDFTLRGAETTHIPTENKTYWRGGANNQHYDGYFVANIDPYSIPSTSITDIYASPWAAEAYAKMKPAQPVFNFLNSAFELRELPGMLRQRFRGAGLHEIGDYHLALQFGWIPLLRDVRNLVTFQRQAQARLKQLLRDNGKPVRRSILLKDTHTPGGVTSGTLYSAFQPVLVTQYYVTQPTWKLTTWSTDRVWASARFRFWLPGGPRDVAWRRKMINRLFGLTPSPSVIYNAIPWTWLIDWFSNLGSLIDNLDSGVADRLAADYVYLMRERHWLSEFQARGQFRNRDGSVFVASASAVSESFTKTRVRGGPFDPAILENDLNGKQLAILGALGLSRMK